VFVNGELVRDRARLSDTVDANDDIYVFQALTGG
jgi:sulfur carrier protein ThiS